MNEKYEYVIAYSLSGVTRPTDSEDVIILTSSDASVTLSGNPDEALGHADRDSAVRTGILKGLFTPSEVKNLDDEVAALRANRKHLLGNAGCLVIRFCGPVTLDRSSQIVERGSYRFGFDLLDKDAIRGVRRHEVSAILAGLLSVLPKVSDALKVAESVYILDDTGLATYTSNPKVSALASVVRVLSGGYGDGYVGRGSGPAVIRVRASAAIGR